MCIDSIWISLKTSIVNLTTTNRSSILLWLYVTVMFLAERPLNRPDVLEFSMQYSIFASFDNFLRYFPISAGWDLRAPWAARAAQVAGAAFQVVTPLRDKRQTAANKSTVFYRATHCRQSEQWACWNLGVQQTDLNFSGVWNAWPEVFSYSIDYQLSMTYSGRSGDRAHMRIDPVVKVKAKKWPDCSLRHHRDLQIAKFLILSRGGRGGWGPGRAWEPPLNPNHYIA